MNRFLNILIVLLLTAGWARSSEIESTISPTFQDTESWVLKGKVLDEKDMPLPGASILVKGSKRGAVTDNDGRFIIEILSENDSLKVSFVGYKTKTISAGKARNLTVKLLPSDDNALDEVSVVGYGTQKKISVTGAISTISTTEIERTATPSLSNAISGKLPGIITRQAIGEPGYDAAQVYIRGLSTWVQSAPLVLIDGVERDMNNINANEIESFTVLKDASSTAVYGVRGANGVILINTKRGKRAKPQVTFRSETAMLTSLRMPEYVNSADYATLWNEGLASRELVPRWSAEEIEKFKDGSDPYFYPNTDWADVILKKNTSQTINNLSVSGGNDFIRYYTNVGYTMQDGIYKEDKSFEYPTNAQIKRYNFRSNVDIDLSKALTMQLGLGGIIQNGNYPAGGSSYDIFNSLRMLPPYVFPPTNPDGTTASTGAYPGVGIFQNPYGMVARSGYSKQDRSTLQGTFGTNWDLTSLVKGLSLRGKFAYDRYGQTDNNRFKTYLMKQYTGKDPVTGEDMYNVIRPEQPLGFGTGNNSNRAIYTELQTAYDRSFDKHIVSAMLLYNQRDYVDLTAGSSIANLAFRQQGIAGRTTYNFDNRYLVEFNFGYNGSENFPKGKRFGFFPSVSAGWILSNEKFWNANFINNLKIRASRGLVGNDKIGGSRFLFLTKINTNLLNYRFGNGNTTEFQGAQEALTGNPDVTWEVATKNNLGIDLGLFQNKVTLQVDAFSEFRKGILIQRAIVPEVVGILPSALPWGNLGKTKNKGLDGLLEIRNTTSNGLFYSMRGNFTYARNTVIENDEPIQKYSYQSGKGLPIGQQMALVSEGLYQSTDEISNGPKSRYMENIRVGDIKYKDVNGDGWIDDFDRIPVGYTRNPEITFGLGGTVALKGFDLSLYFTGAANTSIFMDGWAIMPFWDGAGTNNVLQDYFDNRWTPTNTDAKFPAIDNGKNSHNYARSTQYMKNGNFLRLKNAEIGYSIPQKKSQKFGVNQLRFFLNGTNIYTWDSVKIIDPESNDGTGFYPLQRSLNIGLQVDFK